MAPSKRPVYKTKARKVLKRSSKRRGPTSATQRPSIGRLAAYGVRSVLGMLPGAPFTTKLADFVFKSLGVSKSVNVDIKSSKITADQTFIVSTATSFVITPGNILASTKLMYNSDDGHKCSRYSASRVLSLTVSVSPDNIVSQQAGEIVLGLSPFWEIDTTSTNGRYPTAEGVSGMYLSIRSPATKPVSLTFRPRPSDGRTYQYMDHGERFAWVQFIYLKENRTSYSEFNADEVSFKIAISGRLETRSGNNSSGSTHGNNITDTIEDLLQHTGMAIEDATTKRIYQLRTTNLTTTPLTNSKYGGFKVEGTLYPNVNELSLASMEI